MTYLEELEKLAQAANGLAIVEREFLPTILQSAESEAFTRLRLLGEPLYPVSLVNLQIGDILIWNGTNWVNVSISDLISELVDIRLEALIPVMNAQSELLRAIVVAMAKVTDTPPKALVEEGEVLSERSPE